MRIVRIAETILNSLRVFASLREIQNYTLRTQLSIRCVIFEWEESAIALSSQDLDEFKEGLKN